MTTVWVLSEESPVTNMDESRGVVCGVFETAEAALFHLGTSMLDPDSAADILWETIRQDSYYEGWGQGGDLYILHKCPVEALASLREDFTTFCEAPPTIPHPYLTISTAELRARLGEVPTEDLAP